MNTELFADASALLCYYSHSL